MREKDTITAIATPQGVGALAIIRVSGEESHTIVETILSEKEKFSKVKNRIISNYTVIDEKKIIDEITAIKYRSPFSYTGENLVEIFCHGGIYTKEKIVELLLSNGSRIADKGEFTKRAFINGKIDLMKAESIQAIIESSNSVEHQTAIDYYKLKSQKTIEDFKSRIQIELSKIEAEIEFQEDEQNDIKSESERAVTTLLVHFQKEILKRQKIQDSNKGMQVLLLGPTNAGKSSIFNEIIGTNRAIVSNIHGTTRDSISEHITINKREVIVIDTAGIRKSDDCIEIEGQKRTIEKVNEADVLLWVTDSSTEIIDEEKEAFLRIVKKNPVIILNKSDLSHNDDKESFYRNHENLTLQISTKNKDNFDCLFSLLEKRSESYFSAEDSSSFILNQRQQRHFEEIVSYIESAIQQWSQKEIAAYYLKKAMDEIDVITGKTGNSEIVNRIFETFCIGK